MRAAAKRRRGILGQPVSCGGVLVWPADLIVADDTGVVVLPAGEIDGLLTKARARVQQETTLRAGLRDGRTTLELLELQQYLDGPQGTDRGAKGR
jgi:4-hydroxy-4-methyl-2-oxoglutarate aldolase